LRAVDVGDDFGCNDLISVDIISNMTKTSIEIDRDIAKQAATILGTTTLRDTVNASLLEIVNAQRRLELVSMLSDEHRFDFESTDDAWGGDT
jgi:Arc/MetJ family transcription regulator